MLCAMLIPAARFPLGGPPPPVIAPREDLKAFSPGGEKGFKTVPKTAFSPTWCAPARA